MAWELGTKRAAVRIQSQRHCQKGASADLKYELAEGFNIESAIFDWARQRMDDGKRLISAFYGKAIVNCQLISIFPDWVRMTSHLSSHFCQSQECNYRLISLPFIVFHLIVAANVSCPIMHALCCIVFLIYRASNGLHSFSTLGRAVATPRISLTFAHDHEIISILLGQCPSRSQNLTLHCNY